MGARAPMFNIGHNNLHHYQAPIFNIDDIYDDDEDYYTNQQPFNLDDIKLNLNDIYFNDIELNINDIIINNINIITYN
jgi:hypothetical protein